MRKSKSNKPIEADPVLQCAAALNLSQDQHVLVRQVQESARDLPMGGTEDLEKVLYMRVRGANYPRYCYSDGTFKSITLGVTFWLTVGKLLWYIIKWWISRHNAE